jgi:LemA protein
MTNTIIAVAFAGMLVLMIGLGGLLIYNGLRALQVACDDAWSLIEVQLKRRADLVPNLLTTVKAYATHEQQLFEATTAARQRAADAPDATPQHARAELVLGAAIRNVVVLGEGYPELAASKNFLQLQQRLADLEDQIAAARGIYNGNVAAYLTELQQFPSSIVAKRFDFPDRELFRLSDPSERMGSSVSLGA